jgi:hypothetical protein
MISRLTSATARATDARLTLPACEEVAGVAANASKATAALDGTQTRMRVPLKKHRRKCGSHLKGPNKPESPKPLADGRVCTGPSWRSAGLDGAGRQACSRRRTQTTVTGNSSRRSASPRDVRLAPTSGRRRRGWSAGQRFIASFGNILPGTDPDGASPTS